MNPLPPDELLPADFQGWNHNNKIFEDIVNQYEPFTVVEVGTWKGMSAINFHKALTKLGKPFRLICCDTWLGGIEHMNGREYGGLYKEKHGYPQLYYQFYSNMQHAGCLDHVVALPNTSVNCARWLKKSHIDADVIYVDASHEDPDVYYDLKFFWEILNTDGVMFGDDYVYGPVNQCVNRFAAENNLSIQVHDGNYWILKKVVN